MLVLPVERSCVVFCASRAQTKTRLSASSFEEVLRLLVVNERESRRYYTNFAENTSSAKTASPEAGVRKSRLDKIDTFFSRRTSLVQNFRSCLPHFVPSQSRMAFKGGPGQKVQKVMVQPINLIFRYLQNRARIQVWLYENTSMRIEGHIIGFDEYMNLVLDDAEEINTKSRQRKQVGRILLKGENITLIMSVQTM
ncbi:uncharacterized protein LOC144138169 isoform X1 [Haemaphysalis longicornis]